MSIEATCGPVAEQRVAVVEVVAVVEAAVVEVAVAVVGKRRTVNKRSQICTAKLAEIELTATFSSPCLSLCGMCAALVLVPISRPSINRALHVHDCPTNCPIPSAPGHKVVPSFFTFELAVYSVSYSVSVCSHVCTLCSVRCRSN